MALADHYGSRPDFLPRDWIRVVRAVPPSDRLLRWTGRPGVRLLSLDEHRQYARDSADRYPHNADGVIEWAAVPAELVLCTVTADADPAVLRTVLRRHAPKAGELVFFWSSLAVPSVLTTFQHCADRLSELAESEPELWIFSPADRVLVELSFSGVVTAARVPRSAP